MEKLLSREQFRVQTLLRLDGKCTLPFCSAVAVDAHHILNRNLFTTAEKFGGYFLSNGAPLCSRHHLEAERSEISVESIREHLGIVSPTLPEGFLPSVHYDTWGNILTSSFTRIPGPLFEDEGCQKALSRVLWMFPKV
jgi:hypothetical protein